MNRKLAITMAFSLLFSLLVALPASADAAESSDELQDAVGVEGIREHQAALQAIADANGGTRAAGTAGYDASADYVASVLNDAGYTVQVLPFEFPFFEETTPTLLSQTAPAAVDYVDQEDFSVMTFSGSGSTGDVAYTPVDLSLTDRDASTSGCEIEDFADFVAGTIALMQRGACSFADKATNAEASGAVGAVVFNQGNTPDREELLFGTLGDPGSGIPVIGTTFAVGEALAAEATGAMTVDALSEIRSTTNVIAQSTTGDPDNVVMAGAHLDSVPEGAGIQDNGTGSGTILEIAVQLAEEFGANDEGASELTNAVRFGWWGAEEFGLLGSIDYVVGLSDEELAKIQVYQNYDMIGSPNFVRFVYDGDGSDIPAEIGVPDSSAVLEQVFLDHFAGEGLQTEATILGQRSDHFAFCVSGIACGGLFTGAEGLKTAEQVSIYGGVEGEQYDQCYHDVCDTFDNISLTGLDQMSNAAADAMAVYAFTPLCNGLPATIVGTDGDNVINGTDGDDVIVALGGNDTVNGGDGDDTICLGEGDDSAVGGVGDDAINGEGGIDTINGSRGADTIDGGTENDVLNGGSGGDTMSGGDGDDRILGAGANDTIDAGLGNDVVLGGQGDDTIDLGGGDDRGVGGNGKDNIMGGAGNDEITGGNQADVLDGGDDVDKLSGGGGNDTCLNGETLSSCEEEGPALGAFSLRTFGAGTQLGSGGLTPQFHDHDGHPVPS